jgi:hypothetical protein
VRAAYWALRPMCTAGSGLAGELKREAGGKLLYYDGHCWTAKPVPPTDLPF